MHPADTCTEVNGDVLDLETYYPQTHGNAIGYRVPIQWHPSQYCKDSNIHMRFPSLETSRRIGCGASLEFGHGPGHGIGAGSALVGPSSTIMQTEYEGLPVTK